MSMKHKLQAYALLLRHYKDLFKRNWEVRDQLGGNFFKEEEAEFLPAALSLQEKPVSPSMRITAKLLIALIFVMLGWAVFGRMDIVVNAGGEIIPSARTKSIASVEVASVTALHVQEGQFVHKGDLLIELDASASNAEHDKAMSSVVDATLKIARSRAMIAAIDGHRPPRLAPVAGVEAAKLAEAQGYLDGQYREFIANLERFDGQIARYQEALPLATQQARDYKALSQTHDVSMHAYLEKEQARVDLEGQLNEARNQRAALVAQIRRAAYDAWDEGERVLGAAREDAIRAQAHSRLLKLTAPVDGTVQQLRVHTIGGVVPAAQELMRIVPREEHLIVEAKLENKDIGFLEEGQTAAVKVAAYDYTKYGTIPAHVVHVSRDAIQDEKRGLLYSVIIALDRSYILVNGKDMPLSAGMVVDVEIKTGSRRVIEYVLSPLIQHTRESLHER